MSDSDSKSPKFVGQQKPKHKDLYKTSPNSINWRQIYKKQCLSRINEKRNESRNKLIDKFRNIDLNDTTSAEQIQTQNHEIVDEVMQTVWDLVRNHLPPIDNEDISDFMEEIRQELLSEESLYWEQLTEWRKQEELDWMVSNRDSVVCFFCQKSPLKVISLDKFKTQLFCSNCGFNFVAQFLLTLGYLQERVDNIVSNHSSICNKTSLKFSLINDCSNNGSNNILAFCEVCHLSDLMFKDFNYLSANQF